VSKDSLPKEKPDPEFKFVIDFVHEWKPQRTLEVGVNFGREIKMLEGLTEIYGIDHDPEKIALARTYIPSGNFEVAEADNLPYENNTMDLVYSSGVLSKTPPEKVSDIIREMIRVSRKRVVLLEYLGTRMTPDPNLYVNCKKGAFIHDYDSLFIGRACEVLTSKEVVVGYDKFRLMIIAKDASYMSNVVDIDTKIDEFKELRKDFSREIKLLREDIRGLIENNNLENSSIVNIEPKVDAAIELLNSEILPQISSLIKEISSLKDEIKKIQDKEKLVSIPEVASTPDRWSRFKSWLGGVRRVMFKKEVK